MFTSIYTSIHRTQNCDYTIGIYQSITINIASNLRVLSLTVKWYQAVRNFSARFHRFIDQIGKYMKHYRRDLSIRITANIPNALSIRAMPIYPIHILRNSRCDGERRLDRHNYSNRISILKAWVIDWGIFFFLRSRILASRAKWRAKFRTYFA